MAKIKLGNVKGPKGDQGVRGSKWFNTANITGTSTSGTAFPNSGIASAMVGDMALNPTTLNLYICKTAGNAATAKWAFIACIKGPQGAKGDKGDPTTVDAVLSESSANPIQNKAVATKFKDVQDSLDRHFASSVDAADLLSIDPANPQDSSNLPQRIAVDDCSKLSNRPDAWSSGTVIAYRLVYLMGGHAIVLLIEGFPRHRIWMNFYNGGSRSWDGWGQV